jgi:hypothetical protein
MWRMAKEPTPSAHLKRQLNARISDQAHDRLERLMTRDKRGKAATIEAALELLEGANGSDDRAALLDIAAALKRAGIR